MNKNEINRNKRDRNKRSKNKGKRKSRKFYKKLASKVWRSKKRGSGCNYKKTFSKWKIDGT